MRLVNVLVLLLAIGLCTGVAIADPKNDTGESWDHSWMGARATYPEAEPNNPCPTSQVVSLGDIVDPAALSPAGDFDFYKITLLTTDRLTVIMDRATGCTTTIDTYVDILRDDCTTVIFSDDDDGPGAYSYIRGNEWTPPYDGDYYVKVRHYSATGTGCYKIWFYAGLTGDGACCSTAGVCTLVGPGSCSSPSTFQGPGTVCDPNPCFVAPTGACCNPSTGACTLTVQASCASPSVWHGEWTTCTPNPCPPPVLGACCATTGFCTLTVQTSCVSPSVWHGEWTACVPNPCPGAQPPPVNDTCGGAIALERCTTGTVSGDLTWAANDYTTAGSTGCTGYFAPGLDVVYAVTLQAGDILHLVYTTPSHDGSLYVITDCASPATTCVVGEDDPEPETITWTALADGVYYIIADAYSGGAAFTLEYAITCPPPVGACCFLDGTCQMMTQDDCAANSGTWFALLGCEPNMCPAPPADVACCFPDGSCQMLTEVACAAAGGVVLGGVACEPQNPCPQPPPEAACCFADGSCQLLLESACAQLGGTWNAGLTCTPNPCPPPPATGACCFVDGTCQVLTEAACVTAQGTYQGNNVLCTPNPCETPNPTERTTWGRVKNTYR